MPTVLGRIRGLVSPIFADEPVRRGDAGSGGAGIATTSSPGIVEPDGSSIAVDGSGIISVIGAGGARIPASVPNLMWWWDASIITEAPGSLIGVLPNPNPARIYGHAYPVNFQSSTPGYGAAVAAAAVNGHPVLDLTVGNSNTAYDHLFLVNFAGAMTYFAVLNPLSITVGDHFAGPSHAMSVATSATQQLQIVETSTAVRQSSTGTMTANAWQQVNVTWLNSSKAYAFRIAKASAGSGTAANSFNIATVASQGLFWNFAAPANYYAGLFAEMLIYNRVLSGTEITAIENYLTAKWGV